MITGQAWTDIGRSVDNFELARLLIQHIVALFVAGCVGGDVMLPLLLTLDEAHMAWFSFNSLRSMQKHCCRGGATTGWHRGLNDVMTATLHELQGQDGGSQYPGVPLEELAGLMQNPWMGQRPCSH